MTDRIWQLTAVLGLLVVAGCGSDDEVSSAPATPPPPSAPPPAIAAAGGNRNQPQRPSPPTRSGQNTARTTEPDLPDVPPQQLFLIQSDVPGFELIPPEVAVEEKLYAVTLPAAGQDSTVLHLERPPDALPPRQATAPSSEALLPEGFVAVSSAGRSADGLPLQIRCEKDDSRMVLIPGGLFVQGEDGVDPHAGPAHPVQLDPFYMDVTEVTLAQFERFRSEYTPRPVPAGNADAPGDHPVVGIAWRTALAYTKWSGKELPTEAEWEKAARGPDGYLYPWGDGRVVWQRARTPDQIDAVMSFRTDRSVYGVYDLAGNAREWCADYYAPDYYAREMERAGGLIENPDGPNRAAISGHRVVRGNAPHWQLWHRASENMSDAPSDVGFRGVVRIELPEEDDAATPAGSTNDPPPTRRPTGRQ